MNSQSVARIGAWAASVAALTALSLAFPLATRAAPLHNPALTHPDLEGGFYYEDSDPWGIVPNGWHRWYVTPANGCDNMQPAFTQITTAMDSARVHSGASALQIYSQYTRYTAGLYQPVGGVTPGTYLTFSMYGYMWSSSADDVRKTEGGALNTFMRVGIDPTGGTDPTASTVVWGGAYTQFDSFRQYTVSATAANSTITVFNYVHPDVCARHNDAFWDDASLTVSNVTPTPTPTVTPTATATSASGATPAAVSTPVVGGTPTAGGTTIITVKSGESLLTYANRYGLSASALLASNNFSDPNLLFPGQQVVLPIVVGTTPSLNEPFYYTTQAGETLYSIATKYYLTVALLAKANSVADNTALLPAGTTLFILPGPHVYTVQKGDTLAKIAEIFSTTATKLAKVNNTADTQLYIGQPLFIPINYR